MNPPLSQSETPSAPPVDPSAAAEKAAEVAAAAEAAPTADSAQTPQDRLESLAQQAAQARLRSEEEDEAAALLQALMASGGLGLGHALTYLGRFNWNVTVQALNAAWPEMSATAKETLLSGLKRDEFRTEAARRVRLSLARGIFKQDAEAAAKIIGGVCAELRKVADEEPLTKTERRNFDSVMIGKGRPWICQLPLADWRAAESNPVVQVAVAVCFSGNVPPFSQLSMLKWLAEGGRLDKLAEESLALVTEAIARWSAKWKGALVRELPELPEAIAQAAAVPEPARVEAQPAQEPAEKTRPARGAAVDDDEEEDDEDEDDEEEVDDEDEDEDDEEEEVDDEDEDEDDDEDDDEEGEETDEESAASSESEASEGAGPQRLSRRERFRLRRQQRAEAKAAAAAARAGKESPGVENGGRGGRTPDFREALRLVERHYNTLKTELDVARANLRQRSSKRRRDFEHEPDLPESEQVALRQHNARLEATVAELRERIDALTAAAEDEATSREAFGDGQAPSEKDQFVTLIGLKLARAKADYDATHGRLRDDVFGDNYRTMLQTVFGVLEEHGVVFPKPEEPVDPPTV
ncbi:MAG: hypothetical protein JSR82_14260 [Verrucomicrobia bacterium]|nr:hypothetical protein [Verrucomicrobiota bacterium]